MASIYRNKGYEGAGIAGRNAYIESMRDQFANEATWQSFADRIRREDTSTDPGYVRPYTEPAAPPRPQTPGGPVERGVGPPLIGQPAVTSTPMPAPAPAPTPGAGMPAAAPAPGGGGGGLKPPTNSGPAKPTSALGSLDVSGGAMGMGMPMQPTAPPAAGGIGRAGNRPSRPLEGLQVSMLGKRAY